MRSRPWLHFVTHKASTTWHQASWKFPAWNPRSLPFLLSGSCLICPVLGRLRQGMADGRPPGFLSLHPLAPWYPLPSPCLLPTYLPDHTPAYMAFPSLRAPSSSASSPCNLCFSWSSEALARRASPFHRAVNSTRAALRAHWGAQ